MLSAPALKILVIEDQLIIAADICVQLLKLGNTVIGVNRSMAHAFQTIQHTAPDIVLINIGLKETTERIAGAHILMQNYHIPVIVLSAHIEQATFDLLTGLLPYAFIAKPFDPADLQGGIVFARQRMVAEARAASKIAG
jgi:AmiR/NasT family two-component response regulator